MEQRLVDYLASIGADPSALDGWEVRTAQRAGADVAFVVTRGCEIHFVSLVGPRAMTRKNIAQYLCPIIEQHGYASTRVPLAETDHKLRLALGFVHTWDCSQFSYWMTTACPYDRKNKHEGMTPCL